jgi:hypothetical protein
MGRAIGPPRRIAAPVMENEMNPMHPSRPSRQGGVAAAVMSLASLFVLASPLALPACVASEEVVVDRAPPEPLVEPVYVAPSPAHVWVGGYWEWHDRWVWVPGHWAPPPRAHAAWVPGRWEPRGARWVWRPGYWR